MNIKNFKPGDLITRVFSHVAFTDGVDVYAEAAIAGEKLKFNGIEHGVIYLESAQGSIRLLLTDIMGYDWSEGWDYYQGPEDQVVQKHHKNWFYAGLTIYVLFLMALSFFTQDAVFYGLLLLGGSGLMCFGIYITKSEI